MPLPTPSPHLLRHLRRATLSLPSTLAPRPISLSSPPLPSLKSTTSPQNRLLSSSPPPTHDRGPPSSEPTQTNFNTLDVLSSTTPPTSAIDACLADGFHFDNGLKIDDGSGALIVGGEVFGWRPWRTLAEGKEGGREREEKEKKGEMVDRKGVWGGFGGEGNGGEEAVWGVLGLVWPKPDMLILGLGAKTYPLAPGTRRYINSLGIRVDVLDTRNAAAQFNLLATERGVGDIAAALIPVGWRAGTR
ncbi:hypothetical protein MMC10_010604 [Thelotrema lepadinum]|nr:hypothetical protein [Thelotrema lepadinum]